jgi:hypothetical protein
MLHVVPERARRAPYQETFINLVEVEFDGHKGCGASVLCEVEFTQTPVIPARCHGDPSDFQPTEGGETEIILVRPFEYRMLETGFKGTERHYLPAAPWLVELLTECVDIDCLKADRS